MDPKKNEAARQKLINKGLKLLSYRPRSTSELKFRLSRYKYATPDLVNQTLNHLLDLELLDDQKFASWWVDQRTSHKPKGNIAIKTELIQKGIDRSVIDSVLLSKDQEVKLAKKLVITKKITNKQKTYQYLYSRGFSSNIINSVIDELSSNT